MDRTNASSPVEDLERAVRDCQSRDYNLEGIPMFLMLGGPAPAPGGAPGGVPGGVPGGAPGGRLDRLAADYLGRLVADGQQASLLDAATALEVLAAYHFDPDDGEDPVAGTALGGLAAGPLVRTINYHNTARAQSADIERQLLAAGKRFRAVDEEDLDGLLSGRGWQGRKPPLIPVFYEGYRNNYDVALPLLERAGLLGWFFIPTSFIDTPVPEQFTFARTHYIGLTQDDYAGTRCAMTWDELRDVVARGHIVACHTATHCTVADIKSRKDVQRELVGPRQRFAEELGREVKTLAWLSGTSFGENERVDAAVRKAGYRTIFSNAKIQHLPSL